MKKLTLTLGIMLCVALAFTGCGKKQKNIEDWTDEDFEQAFEDLDKDYENGESVENDSEEETEIEIAFEPSEEILNADLFSGKIQVYDDVFQNGGYLTIDQLISQYGDKYDFSGIDPDAFATKGSRYNTFTAVHYNYFYSSGVLYELLEGSKYEANIGISVCYDGPNEDHVRIGDCPVSYVVGGTSKCLWYPGGLVCKAETGFDYSNFLDEYVLPLGLTEIPLEKSGRCAATYAGMDAGEIIQVNCFVYGDDYYGAGSDAYLIGVIGETDNLYGKKPIYKFEFMENKDDGKIFLNGINVFPNCGLEYVTEW